MIRVRVPRGARRFQVTIEQARMESGTDRRDWYVVAAFDQGRNRIGRCRFTGGSADSTIRPGVRRLWSQVIWNFKRRTDVIFIRFRTSKSLMLEAHVDFF